MQESIIVYRNPIEKMFWEGNWGLYLLYFLAFVAPFILVLQAFGNRTKSSLMNFVMWFSAIGCGIVGCLCLHFLITL